MRDSLINLEELEKMGIQDGDTVRIFDFEFEWTR